jgi:hypothetical protein
LLWAVQLRGQGSLASLHAAAGPTNIILPLTRRPTLLLNSLCGFCLPLLS